MLLEVHYGDDSVLLVNGHCRGIHLLEYIRTRCQLPLSLAIDLCLINSGEPFRLASFESKLLPFERGDFPSHLQCVLAQIDDQGTYIPLLNNPKLMNTDFLAKLKKATSTKCATKIFSKPTKQPVVISSPKQRQQQQQQQQQEQQQQEQEQQPQLQPLPQQVVRKRRSLKAIAIAATFITINHH